MSLWDFDAGESTLTDWSSLNQFDDMVWNEFGENGDHLAAEDPNVHRDLWGTNGGCHKKMTVECNLKGFSTKDSFYFRGPSESCNEISTSVKHEAEKDVLTNEAPVQDTLLGNSWSDLGSVVDLPLDHQPVNCRTLIGPREKYGLYGGQVLKHDSDDMLKEEVGLYMGEEDGSMVSDPFSMSEVGSPAHDVELLGDGSIDGKDGFLDLGWPNMECFDDMDKLFRNSDSPFEPLMSADTHGLEWPCTPLTPASTTPDPVEGGPGPTERKDRGISFDGRQHAASSVESSFGFAESSSHDAGTKPTSISRSAPAPRLPFPSGGKVESLDEAKSSVAAQRTVEKAEDPRQCSRTPNNADKVDQSQERRDVTRLSTQAQKGRRNTATKKRNEEKLKRGSTYKKLSPSVPYVVPHQDMRQFPLCMPGQPAHLQGSFAPPPLQIFSPTSTMMAVTPNQYQIPQSVPYVQLGYPLHHPVPVMPSKPFSHLHHMQPMVIDLQARNVHKARASNQMVQSIFTPLASGVPLQAPGSGDTLQAFHNHSSFAMSCRPPTSTPNMTPQEKLEKLRWRQQIQARIAVEQQQQQLLASQKGEVEALIYHGQNESSVPNLSQVQPQPGQMAAEPLDKMRMADDTEKMHFAPATTGGVTERDSSLEGSVLGQLESTISRLEVGTRLVIRNSLYRLARSARKRRAAGGENRVSSQSSVERYSGSNAVESSTASDSPSWRGSRSTKSTEMETQTNPIDRSIAKLLFNKPQSQFRPGSVYFSDGALVPNGATVPGCLPTTTWELTPASVLPTSDMSPMSSLAPQLCAKTDELPLHNWTLVPSLIGASVAVPPGDPAFGRFLPLTGVPDQANINSPSSPQLNNRGSITIDPVPLVQLQTPKQAKNSSTEDAIGQGMVKLESLESKGNASTARVETKANRVQFINSSFVPDAITHTNFVGSCVRNFRLHAPYETRDLAVVPVNDVACLEEDPAQFVSSGHEAPAVTDDKPKVC